MSEAARAAYWEQVVTGGYPVPDDAPLADLTTELTVMLGSPEPHLRERLALGTLRHWVTSGVYDDLLEGLGTGISAGLRVGLGEDGTDAVLRRTASAEVLAACLERTRESPEALAAMDAGTVLRWGDALLSWFVREQDLRGYLPSRGWADAVSRGARGCEVLATLPGFGEAELVAVLDVVAERLTSPTSYRFVDAGPDRLAAAALAVLRRDLVDAAVVEEWLDGLVEAARDKHGQAVVARNVEDFLRALHLQVLLTAEPPTARADLLLALVGALRRSNDDLLGPSPST